MVVELAFDEEPKKRPAEAGRFHFSVAGAGIS